RAQAADRADVALTQLAHSADNRFDPRSFLLARERRRANRARAGERPRRRLRRRQSGVDEVLLEPVARIPGAKSVIVRAFQPSDEPGVIELWRRCDLTRPWNDPHKDIARKLKVRPDLFLVGKIDGAVV